MKHVRLAAFLSSIVLTLALSSLAQTSQPAKPEPASPPAHATTQNVSPVDKIQNTMPRQSPGGSFDSGIYLQRMAGTGMCGSIVSYNFSKGENPILETVTTCTPSDVTTIRRAHGHDQKPTVPQFREIKDTQAKP